MKFLITFTAAIFFIFFSCQSDKNKNTIKINIVDDIQDKDPRKIRNLNSTIFMKMIYEGLTRVDKNKEIKLALAKDVKISKDGKKYTFFLRKTTWSDGKELTSYDFKNSWKKILTPSFPPHMAYQLFIIKGAKEAKENKISIDEVKIETPDAYTLKVELEKPLFYFLELLSTPIFFPVREKDNSYISNGPFKIKTWKNQDKIELVKNEKYWDSSNVKLNKLILYMMYEETELNMFKAKKIDWAGSPFSVLPLDSLKTLSNLKSFCKSPYLGTSFLRVNTKYFNENIEKAPLFIKSLSKSIDRKNIIKHILHNSQIIAHKLIPPHMIENSYNIKSEDFKNIGNFPTKIKLSYKNDKRNHLIAQAIQRDWENNLKIKVELEILESKMFYDKICSGNYQLAMGSWIADFNDPINFLEVFKYKNNGTNNTFWENKQYIEMLNEIENCTKIKTRKSIIKKAETLLIEDMPIIPIYHINMCFLKNPKIKDVIISSLGHVDFKYAYIEN